MTRSSLALALVGLCGCIGSPKSRSGPEMDWLTYKPQVEALIAGEFSGAVIDQTPAGQEGYQPCAVAGQAYSLPLDVGDPVACGDQEGHEEDSGSDCSEALVASFPVSGPLSLEGAELGEVTGSVRAQSYDCGIDLQVDLAPPPGDFPRQTFELEWQHDDEGQASPASFLWGRRLSEDGAEETAWEVCVLPVEERG